MDSNNPAAACPLNGQIEMFCCGVDNLASCGILKHYIDIATYQKKYDVFGRISETEITKNGKHILAHEYEYRNIK
jgi:hypothetical protein